MTGNKNAWRAPLAGLASVAMIATMGVAASTANAADATPSVDVTFHVDGTVENSPKISGDDKVLPGETLADALGGYNTGISFAGKYFVGWTTADGSYYDFDEPITSSLDLYADYETSPENVVKVVVKANGLLYPDASHSKDGGVEYYVRQGQSIPAQRLPKDAADGKLVTAWVAGGETKEATIDKLVVNNVYEPEGGDGFVIEPAADSTIDVAQFTINATDYGYVNGAKSDGDGTDAYVKDVVDDATVDVPAFVSTVTAPVKTPTGWKDAKGKKYSLAQTGITVPEGGLELTALAGVTEKFSVTFVANGKTVKSEQVAKNAFATAPADPSKEGFSFKGWTSDQFPGKTFKTAEDFKAEGSAITQDTVFTAVFMNKTTKVEVTFEDTDYEGKNESKTIEVAGGDYIDASQAPAWTRKGYVLAGWTKAEDPSAESAKFDFTTEQIVDGTKNFTLRPIWTKVSVDQADAALRYVQVAIDGEYKRDDSKFFTADSFKAFKGVYTKAYQTYKNMDYTSPSISAEQSAQIVSDLKAGWAQLEFDNSAENTDEIYRLASGWDGRLHHVLTGSAYEAAVLTNTITTDGVGGWVKEASPFRAFASDSKVVELFADFPVVSDNGVQSDELSEVATPLVVLAQRVYNAELNEHMYTTDTNEVDTITKNGWSKDQESSSFYVPTNKTETPVYRLYNKVSHLHLFTASQNEYNTLLQNPDWNDEGIKFYGIA